MNSFNGLGNLIGQILGIDLNGTGASMAVTTIDHAKLIHDRFIDSIDNLSSKSMTWDQAEDVREFRLRPSTDMRYALDIDQAAADAALLVAPTASPSVDQPARNAFANEWTEWIATSKIGESLPTNTPTPARDLSVASLWFAAVAGAGHTLIVETR